VSRRLLFAVVVLAVPRAAWACPVCFGASDSPLANATNMGIIMMLGVVAVMLGSFAAFFVHLNRRARLFADAGAQPTGAARTRLSTKNPQEGTAQC
jgi:hypothetical protein